MLYKFLSLFIIVLLIPLSSATTATINQNGSYTVVNTTVSSNSITSDILNVTNYMGLVVGSFVDGYSCSSSYCIYHPWYAPTQTYAKNGTTGRIDYSGTNGNIVVSNVISTIVTGNIVEFGQGIFNLTGSTITVPQSKIKLTFKGSKFGTTLLQTAGNSLILFDRSTDNVIEDIEFKSTSFSSGTALIELRNSMRNNFYRISLSGGYYGIWGRGIVGNSFYDIIGSANAGAIANTNTWIYFEPYTSIEYGAVSPNGNRFYNLILEYGNNGVYIGANFEGGNSFYGGILESLSGNGITINETFVPGTISNVHFEANGGNDIEIRHSRYQNLESNFGMGTTDIINSIQTSIFGGGYDILRIEANSSNTNIVNTKWGIVNGYSLQDYSTSTNRMDRLNGVNVINSSILSSTIDLSQTDPVYDRVVLDTQFRENSSGLVTSTSIRDSSMYANDGIWYGSVIPKWTKSPIGFGVILDGVADYISFGNPTSLNFGSGDFSIEFWIKTTDSVNEYIVSKQENGGLYTGYSVELNGGGRIQTEINDNIGQSSKLGQTYVNDGNAHFIVVTRTGGSAVIYVDSVSDGGGTVQAGNTDSTAPLTVGRFPSGGNYCNCTITGIILKNYAMSISEVKTQFYTSQHGKINSFIQTNNFRIVNNTGTIVINTTTKGNLTLVPPGNGITLHSSNGGAWCITVADTTGVVTSTSGACT